MATAAQAWPGASSGGGQEEPTQQGTPLGVIDCWQCGFGNYRHQADVAHSYHVLHNGGFLMNTSLLWYYTRDQVNVKNFLAVLKGDAQSVQKGPHASGRVIEAGKDDRIFLFYSDHGAPGLLGMPTGEFLFADQCMMLFATA
eukprot:jgi/Picre1/31785/NNA_007135.t1